MGKLSRLCAHLNKTLKNSTHDYYCRDLRSEGRDSPSQPSVTDSHDFRTNKFRSFTSVVVAVDW